MGEFGGCVHSIGIHSSQRPVSDLKRHELGFETQFIFNMVYFAGMAINPFTILIFCS